MKINKTLLYFCIPFALTPLLYCLLTDNIWEDFFITFKFSENLCKGYGMVYEPGIKVHGFTSPIGTLVPALCYYITGSESYNSAIWMFRLIFCIPAFVAGGVIILKTILNEFGNESRLPAIFITLLYSFESKSVIFSVNGMETSFMLLFLALSLYLLQKGFHNHWVLTGFSWAGLMWTRPDSCIYVGALIITAFLYSKTSKKTLMISILKASLVTTVLYLPWFVWAWIYYGSPVPHTIQAKGAVLAGLFSSETIKSIIMNAPRRISWVFAPPYPAYREWPFFVGLFSYTAGFFCFLYWMISPLKDDFGKKFSFIFFLLCLYLSYMPYAYPWYFPPVALTGIIVIASATFSLFKNLKDLAVQKKYHIYTMTVISLVLFASLVLNFLHMRIQQKEVEFGNRMQIGLWLKDNIRKNDRIYLECVGYIGYFSNAKMLDFPGLVSPEVVKARKERKLNFITLPEYLKPEWAVLRPSEYYSIYNQNEYFRENYAVAAVFDVKEPINSYSYIPGKSALLFDSCFIIMEKIRK